MTEETLNTLIAAGAGTIILFAIGGVVWAAVILLRRAPNAQTDAFTFADGVLKQSAELSAEIREDGKRREAAAIAHVAALNAMTDALKNIVAQQTKDSAALGSITVAVTTQADARHREVMTAFDINASFYASIIEELHKIKSAMNTIASRIGKRRAAHPVTVALNRINKKLEKFTHDAPHINYPPPHMASVRPVPLDWTRAIHAQYGASANGQPAPVPNGNGTTDA